MFTMQSFRFSFCFNEIRSLIHWSLNTFFIQCEEVGVVKRVHTLLGGVHKLATALKVVEEVQEEVQEIKNE